MDSRSKKSAKSKTSGTSKIKTAKKKAAPDKKKAKKQSPSEQASKRSLWRWVRLFFAMSIWGAIAGVLLLVWFAWDLPRPESAVQAITRAPTMTLLAADGSVLFRKGGVHGNPVTLEELPPSVVQAFVATEDRRFYDHFGIDLIGLGRAMFVNLTRGGYRQGGSGITQQLAKNLFLTKAKTIRRKVQELLLAFWLESSFSKDEILAIYMNRVYLGGGVYGIDAAARLYFGKSASQLNLYESAVLAGLPKAPSANNPRANAERSAKRANLVLDLMVRAGYLQQQQANSLKRKRVNTVGVSRGQNRRYFADWVIGRVAHLIGPMEDDLIIKTSFIPQHQNILEKHATKIMVQASDQKAEQLAAIVMDGNGAVTAMLGGRSWAKSPFNRAVHAKRQTGSVFKTVAYLAGLESGISPDDKIDVSDVTIEGWSPRDQTDEDQSEKIMTMIEGLTRSSNKAAVAIAEKSGRDSVIQIARRLGITAPLQEHASLPLGVHEVSLTEMTSAYSVIAREGRSTTPHAIKEILTGTGDVLFKHYPDDSQAIDEDLAEDMTEMLESVVLNGTGRRAKLNGFAAGKTGTTQLNKDAWFIGFAGSRKNTKEKLTMGVWMGNDKATPMINVSGGGYPAILWQRTMTDLLKTQ